MFCEQCGARSQVGAEYCEDCGAPVAATPSKPSQAPAVQETASLGGAQCYYCTKLILAEALNCPSCGKERRELYQLRDRGRGAIVFTIFFGILLFFSWKYSDDFQRDFGGWGILVRLALFFGVVGVLYGELVFLPALYTD